MGGGGWVGWLSPDDAEHGTFQDGRESLQELSQGMAAIAVKVGHQQQQQEEERGKAFSRVADG